MNNEQKDWVPADFEVDLSQMTIQDVLVMASVAHNPGAMLDMLAIMDKCVAGGVSNLPADAMNAAMEAFADALKVKYPPKPQAPQKKRESRILNELFGGLKL